jgi:hypothetical protein
MSAIVAPPRDARVCAEGRSFNPLLAPRDSPSYSVKAMPAAIHRAPPCGLIENGPSRTAGEDLASSRRMLHGGCC